MRLFKRIREYWQNRRQDPWGDTMQRAYREEGRAAADTPTETMAVHVEPHGIATPETLAALVAKAQEDSRGAQESAETETWGEWDELATQADALANLTPPVEPPPPPPMPYPGDLSNVMVNRITYPDPSEADSPDKDRAYRDMLRRVGVATGTHTDLETTGFWSLRELEPGDGTGAKL